MSALPRGICSVCGQSVPVRRNGAAREHNYQAGAPAIGLCKGSGRPVKPTRDLMPDPAAVARDVAKAIAGAAERDGVLNTLAGVAGKPRRRRQRARLHPGPDPFRRTTQQIDYSSRARRRR